MAGARTGTATAATGTIRPPVAPTASSGTTSPGTRRSASGAGAGRSPAEPVFVRAPDGAGEDEGWVLTVVYDAARDRASW